MKFSSKIAGYSVLFFTFLCFVLVIGRGGNAENKNTQEEHDIAKIAGFVPHKALYDISLTETKSSSQIINISGNMFYEWESTCEAWISDHRFKLSYDYADSPSMKITSDFSVYEPFDGSSMSFSSQRKRNGHLFEEMRGQAQVDEKGAGEAVYNLPADLTYTLSENTQFPMAHSLRILKEIKAGRKFYSATIFDGSDREGPVEVNAFIGSPANALADIDPSPDIDMGLVNVPAHDIRLAFFPVTSESEAADYEMSIVFHENGVISDMLIEYDDFSVRQKLVALEPVVSGCDLAGDGT